MNVQNNLRDRRAQKKRQNNFTCFTDAIASSACNFHFLSYPKLDALSECS